MHIYCYAHACDAERRTSVASAAILEPSTPNVDPSGSTALTVASTPNRSLQRITDVCLCLKTRS